MAVMKAHCRNCNTPLESIMADLGLSPLANALLKQEELSSKEAFFPLCARVCHSCLLVQLDTTISPEDIFREYLYFSSFSQSWLAHAAEYTDTVIHRYQLHPKQHNIIEVASNDGYLLQNFVEQGFPVLGIEPAHNVAKSAQEKGINTHVGFLNTRLATQLVQTGRQADLLIANNVLAHVPDLHDFINSLKTLLKPSGVLTVEFPHLLAMLSEGQFDTIYHEHFFYFSLISAERVMAAHGLKVFDLDVLSSHGGSLRLHICHNEADYQISSHVKSWQEKELLFGLGEISTYTTFSRLIKQIRASFNRFLYDCPPRQIAAYGAPAKGNTFLNYCGVRSDDILFTVDRNPHKQGHFLPGSRIPIYSPEYLEQNQPDFLLILPWNLKKEIQHQLHYLSEKGMRFITAIPSLKVL